MTEILGDLISDILEIENEQIKMIINNLISNLFYYIMIKIV